MNSDQYPAWRKSLLPGLALCFTASAAQALTFEVNTTLDLAADTPSSGVCQAIGSPELCSLRAAIQVANALGGSHSIELPAGTYTLTILDPNDSSAAAGDLASYSELAITGAGAEQSIIDGAEATRVFGVYAGSLTLSDLTIQNGAASDVGGAVQANSDLTLIRSILRNNVANTGGAIFVGLDAKVDIFDSTLVANSALDLGVFNPRGSALRANNSGAIRIISSTFHGNQPIPDQGNNQTISLTLGSLDVLNSTFSGNHAIAISTDNTQVEIRHSTFFNNNQGSIRRFSFDGSHSTLVAASVFQGSGNCVGSQPQSLGYNISSDTSCAFQGSGDLLGVTPMLAPLADNGGPTQTHNLMAESPAINHVPFGQCIGLDGFALTADQRGFSRPVNGLCDSGAVEYLPETIFNDRFEA